MNNAHGKPCLFTISTNCFETRNTSFLLKIQLTLKFYYLYLGIYKIMASGPITSWQIEEKKDFSFLGFKITVDGDYSHEIRQCIKKQRCHFANKGPTSQSYGFPSSHIWMCELDHKEGWAPKNLCCRIVVLEKTIESPLDYQKIKPVNPKGNQPCIFIGKTDTEAEASLLWPADVKS